MRVWRWVRVGSWELKLVVLRLGILRLLSVWLRLVVRVRLEWSGLIISPYGTGGRLLLTANFKVTWHKNWDKSQKSGPEKLYILPPNWRISGHLQLPIINGEIAIKMAEFPTFKGSWPWPLLWPWIPSCITRRPLPITYQVSLKSNKLFAVCVFSYLVYIFLYFLNLLFL